MDVPADYGEKKGIPAGRPGREEDMAQAALFLACNEYAYGQVSFHTLYVTFSLTRGSQTVAVDGGYLLEYP